MHRNSGHRWILPIESYCTAVRRGLSAVCPGAPPSRQTNLDATSRILKNRPKNEIIQTSLNSCVRPSRRRLCLHGASVVDPKTLGRRVK